MPCAEENRYFCQRKQETIHRFFTNESDACSKNLMKSLSIEFHGLWIKPQISCSVRASKNKLGKGSLLYEVILREVMEQLLHR